MKIEPDLWGLGALAAFLLAAGGAVMRSAFVRVVVSELDDDLDPGEARAADDGLARLHADATELRARLSTFEQAHETQQAEMVEQRQRAERQVQGAQAEIERLAAELESERGRARAGQEQLRELEAKLSAQEVEHRRALAGALETKVTPSLQNELSDLQRKLSAVSEERDAARAKTEALERLVEGVRARSRALAEELKTRKGQ